MDFVSNLFKKSKSKNVTPVKQPEPCDNQNKNPHLFDMESSFLQNSVMIPAEFDSNQNGEPDGTNNSNQENQKPRFSILNSFDPIVKKETDELSCNDNLLNEIVLNKPAEFKSFVHPIAEDFVEISPAVHDILGLELNKSSGSNISAQSDNSALNNTVIFLNKSTVENNTPEPNRTEPNKSLNVSSAVKQSEEDLNTADQIFVKGNHKPTEISLPNVSDSDLNTPEQSLINASSISSTLKPDESVEECVTPEQSYFPDEPYRSIVVNDISLNVSSTSTLKLKDESLVIKDQNIKTVIDHSKLKDDIGSGFDSPTANDSFINAFSTKLVFSPNIKELDETLIKNTDTNEEIPNEQIEIKDDINTDEVISNEQIETAIEATVDLDNKCEINGSELPTDITEIPHEISIESVNIINDLIEDINQITTIEKVPLESKDIPIEINISISEVNEEAPEATANKNITFEINSSNSQVSEEESEPPTNKNISFEINSSNSQVNEEAPEPTANKNVSFEINTINSQAYEEAAQPTANKNSSFEINSNNSQVNEEASDPTANNNISFEINTINSQEIEKAPETAANKSISFEINTSNSPVNEAPETIANETSNSQSEVTEELSKTLTKENIKDCSFENKNVSFEVAITSPQIVEETTNEINKEESCQTQSLNCTYENKSVIDTTENVISSSISLEETHMSASEPNSDLNEPTVANRLSLESSTACTNEMGEIINQNECFEKQSDIMNGAIDNKESLEAKVRVYNEMAEKYAIVEAECEKFKVQVADLKKELKICRQKTVALETEVADLKRRENELNVLLEEYKKTVPSKGDANAQDEQLHCLQASEEALKSEVTELKALVNQHESRLKELQRKEVKLADDLTSKTQSEMQISRVMEEYEKSISSLISDNEKMKKERDTAQMHLANIEMAFSDVHQKYERCKSIVQGYKDNEESYKQDIAMNRETIVIQEQKYESLKAHAMNQLEKSNQELATMKKQHDTEMARLTAQLKRYEIKNQSLMESLQQKAKECEQLSAVCDEFIGNV